MNAYIDLLTTTGRMVASNPPLQNLDHKIRLTRSWRLSLAEEIDADVPDVEVGDAPVAAVGAYMAPNCQAFIAGHDPIRGPDKEFFKIFWFESNSCLKSHGPGRVGSVRVTRYSNFTGRVGPP